MNRILRFTGVLIILVGMPLFAWYFLEKGTAMRKNAMRSLEPKTVLGHFETQTEKDQTVTPASLNGKRWLIAVIGIGESRIYAAEVILKLYRQSQDEFHPKFLTITGMNSGEAMPAMSQLLQFPSNNNDWLICYMAAEHIYPFSAEAFNIPEVYRNQPVIILVYENQKIRNYYLINDSRQMQTLVREYPVFLSLKN